MSQSTESPRSRDGHRTTRLAYSYLKKLAATGEPYTDAGMAAETGWKEDGTVSNYRSKHWHHWIKEDVDGSLYVSPTFEGVGEGDFINLHRQRTDFYSKYKRKMYEHAVTYEFFLPLTRERELTRALDAIFYSDTLDRLVKEAGIDKFLPEFPEVASVPESDARNSIIKFVSERFTGYSISHVSGRFRSGDIVPRAKAGEMFAEGDRYLVDETTAVVRFIVPLHESMTAHPTQESFPDGMIAMGGDLTEAGQAELKRVRLAFFLLFAEAVTLTVRGEDEVWLLESGPESRVYVWEKA